MFYTDYQKQVLKDLGYCKVVYEKMYKKNNELGYCSKGDTFYNVHIASDAPTVEVKNIVLLHECGHIFFLHHEINNKKELEDIKQIFKDLNKDFSSISIYGGPQMFLNIAMDLQVNSNVLTLANVKEMNKYFKICTPEAYNIPVYDDFRSYYRPLIERIDDKEFTSQMQDMMKDLQAMEDLMNNPSPFDMDLPQEIRDELAKETYNNHSNESHYVEDESTVEEELKKISASDSTGNEHDCGEKIAIVSTPSEQIQRFLTSILSHNYGRTPDLMRIYNRGTRRNSSNILYSSMRRKPQMDRTQLEVIIDVSGSMDPTDLLTALSSIKDITGRLSPASKIITWDMRKCEEFKITEIPNEVMCGGGTDMSTAVDYAVKDGATSIVIFSDFETDMDRLINSVKASKADIYSIVVGSCSEPRFDEYIKLNKKYMTIQG